jgi:HEPN domain-containing protein
MSKKVSDPTKLFHQAHSFRQAAQALSQQITGIEDGVVLMTPACVLSAFSCELFLKCLICIERGSAPEGHDLLVLFKKLTAQTRKRLKDMWANHTLRYRDKVEETKRLTGVTFETDLERALEAGRNAYTLLRYMHEGTHQKEYAFYLGALPQMLGHVAFELKPEWAEKAKKAFDEVSSQPRTPVDLPVAFSHPFSDGDDKGEFRMIVSPSTKPKPSKSS